MQINWEDYARELTEEMQDPRINKLKVPTHLGLSATRTSRLKKRRDICHTRVVCDVRPGKDDPNRTRITVSGGDIYYQGM